MQFADIIKELYCSKNLNTEQKIEEMRKIFPQLDKKYNMYADDLKTFFTAKLPIIKAVEIETRFGENGSSYVGITEMPEEISPDVQKAIMRIGALLGGFEVEKWGIGYPETEAVKKHFSKYMKSHSVGYVLGEDAGYPKVLRISRNEVDAAPNESYSVCELTGIILS